MRLKPLGRIFLLALALRVGLVLAFADLRIGLDDMFQYDMLARSIAAGNGYRWYAQEDLRLIQRYVGRYLPPIQIPPEYDPRGIPTSFRPPLYPAFLALVYLLVGSGPRRFLAARLVQALLGAALVPLAAQVGRRLGCSERAARWGALGVALYPLLVIYPLALATENLFVFLLLLALWALLRAGERGRAFDYGLAGLLLGLTALTRSAVVPFVPLAALWTGWGVRPWRAGLRNGALVVLAFLLVTMPWSLRNSLLHGEFHFVETDLGYNLYMGYHPQSSGTFSVEFSFDLLPILDDGERNRLGMEAFWSFVRADPARVPYLMARKLSYFWGFDRRGFQYFYCNNFLGDWQPWQVEGALGLLCAPTALVVAAGLAGLVLARPRRQIALAALLVVSFTAGYVLIMAEARFHLPLIPPLAVLAAHTLVDRPWQGAARWQRGLAVLLWLALAANWGWELARDAELLRALIAPGGNQLYLSY